MYAATHTAGHIADAVIIGHDTTAATVSVGVGASLLVCQLHAALLKVLTPAPVDRMGGQRRLLPMGVLQVHGHHCVKGHSLALISFRHRSGDVAILFTPTTMAVNVASFVLCSVLLLSAIAATLLSGIGWPGAKSSCSYWGL